MYAKLDEVKWAMLQEWSETRRALAMPRGCTTAAWRSKAIAQENPMNLLNETHDPSLRSWVASANAAGNDFPLQNLPFAVFRRKGNGEAFRAAQPLATRF